MCLPLLPALAIAGGVMQGAGALMGGMQANQQGKYESRVAKANAALEVESAHESFEAGKDERRQFWRDVGQKRGQQIAGMAANGIDLGFGAGIRTIEDTNMLANEDAAVLYKNIEQRTRGHQINANNFVSEAKAARARGKSALVGSIFGAASSVLGGVTQAAGMKAKAGGG